MLLCPQLISRGYFKSNDEAHPRNVKLVAPRLSTFHQPVF